MTVTIIVGGHFGDEGKGKTISYLCSKLKPRIVARGGVGPNAGHSVVVNGKRYGIRMVPSGFVGKKSRVLIGPGVLVNPDVVLKEIELLTDYDVKKRLGIDYNCGIITKEHINTDCKNDYLKNNIRTTGTGCGPANADRVNRKLTLAKDCKLLQNYLTDVPAEVNAAIESGENVLLEGTQGFGLSLIHGTYPYVTSKDTSASTIAADVGVGPTKIDEVILVFKAYTSRVGGGPFPTKISEEEAEKAGIIEYGTVTGRKRDIGSFDFDLAKRAVLINSPTQLAINCLDLMFPEAKSAKNYEELPTDAKKHIEHIENVLKTPVSLIGIGPEVDEIIDRTI